ncbi:MAG TPA: phospholipid carrier-dependent glycosyltransferase, partial [Acidimicrobiia bacterium]
MSRDNGRFWRILLVIVLGALAFRVGYVALAKWDEPAKGDQVYYNITANQVARGLGFTDPRDGSEIAQHPPLTSLVLVPTSWVNEQLDPGGRHLLAQRFTMAVLGAGVVLLIALVGRRVGGDRVGLVSAAIAALWPALWMNDGLVMSETLAAGGVALSILLAYRFGRDPTWANAGWLGAAIGLCM